METEKYNERKHHALDYHYEESLKPIYQIQTILFIRKYKIINGAITNRDFRLFVMIICISFIVFVFNIIYRIEQVEHFSNLKGNFMKFYSGFDIVWRPIGYFVNIMECYHGERFVQMLISLQNANRTVMCHYKFTKLKLLYWVDILIPIVKLICTVICNLIIYGLNLWTMFQATNLMSLLFVDMNIIYAIHTMGLIKTTLRVWVCKTIQYSKHKTRLSRNVDRGAESMFEGYRNILLAYEMYKEAFQLTVGIIIVN
jgi:hypothetical protein